MHGRGVSKLMKKTKRKGQRISLTTLFERLDDVKDWMSIAAIFACVPNAKMVCQAHALNVGDLFQ